MVAVAGEVDVEKAADGRERQGCLLDSLLRPNEEIYEAAEDLAANIERRINNRRLEGGHTEAATRRTQRGGRPKAKRRFSRAVHVLHATALLFNLL